MTKKRHFLHHYPLKNITEQDFLPGDTCQFLKILERSPVCILFYGRLYALGKICEEVEASPLLHLVN